MLRSMGCARWSHRRSWVSAPVLVALLLAVACLHGEVSPPGPSGPEAAEIDIGRASVAPADSTEVLVSAFGGSSGRVLAIAERSAPDEGEQVPSATAPRRHRSFFGDDAAKAAEEGNATEATKVAKAAKRSKANTANKAAAWVGERDRGHGRGRELHAPGEEDGVRAKATPAPISAREIPGPPTSMQTVLGSTRKRIEARLVSDGIDGDDGWVHYGAGLTIRYEGRRAVEVAIRVPTGLSCAEAARWAGFLQAMPPLYRVGGCAWPGLSARHRLHSGVVGELARTTGILQIWSTKKESH